jgi:hypothetical protein
MKRFTPLIIALLTSAPFRLFAQGTINNTAGGAPPATAIAPRYLVVGTGSSITFWGVMTNIVAFLSQYILYISGAMFVAGALMITISGVKEDYRQTGKNLMIGSVLGMGVVMGGYALLRMVDCFVNSSCSL